MVWTSPGIRSSSVKLPTPDSRLLSFSLVALLPILAALFYRIGDLPLLEDPNDGQYAEVAREMFERGAWVSPTLNGVLFLNKPPLLYWLIEASYAIFGVGEFAARVPGALATLATIALTSRLGALLFSARAGWFAGCAYVAMTSIFAESRFVRPDSLLVASVAGTIYGFVLAFGDDPRLNRRGFLSLQVAIAVGVMAKGMVAVVLPGIALLGACIAARRLDFVLQFLHPRRWILFLFIVAPWHIAAALRHEGFAWDYIVNQHLLFFLDEKLPRDSIPISLGEFWGAFCGRAYPWALFLPVVSLHAVRRFIAGEERWRDALLLAWVGGTLLFFSINVSRLEHYAIPALPGLAVLVGSFLAAISDGERRSSFGLRICSSALVVVLIIALALAARVIGQSGWLSQVAEMPGVARTAAAVALAAALAAWACAYRRPAWLAPVLAIGSLALVPVLHAGLAALAPYDSSKPVADLLLRSGASEAEIVFEAPIEYQHVAGLNFYLRRRVRLVRPDGFVDPVYLVPHSRELFIDRAELERLWKTQTVFLVSDPLRDLPVEAAAIAPGEFEIVGFVGNRWLLKNRHSAR